MQCDDADTFFWTQSLSGMLEKVSVALIDIWTSLCCLVALLGVTSTDTPTHAIHDSTVPLQCPTLTSFFSVEFF